MAKADSLAEAAAVAVKLVSAQKAVARAKTHELAAQAEMDCWFKSNHDLTQNGMKTGVLQLKGNCTIFEILCIFIYVFCVSVISLDF